MLAGQVIVGGVVSTTVTVAWHWLDRPWLSVTVSVTVVTPSEYGPGGLCESVMVSPLSGSNEPLSIEALAVQFGPAETVTLWQRATGGVSRARHCENSEVLFAESVAVAVITFPSDGWYGSKTLKAPMQVLSVEAVVEPR